MCWIETWCIFASPGRRQRTTGDWSPRRGNATAGASVDFPSQTGLLQLYLMPDPSPVGPLREGIVNNLVVKMLTSEASMDRYFSGHSIKGSDI